MLFFYCDRASASLMTLIRGLREEGINAKRIKRRNSRYHKRSGHTVVNWGCSSSLHSVDLNKPDCTKRASDKVQTFENIGTMVPHTLSREEAEEWVDMDEDAVIMCRTLTSSSQGRGIVVAKVAEDIVDAPLYTEFIEAEREMRVHVFQGRVIDYTEKKRLSTETREERGIQDDPSRYIRNHSNHWIFARSGVELPDDVAEMCIDAVGHLGLDFAAVDVLVEPSYVLEINTAPGLEGTTLAKYVEAFKEV